MKTTENDILSDLLCCKINGNLVGIKIKEKDHLMITAIEHLEDGRVTILKPSAIDEYRLNKSTINLSDIESIIHLESESADNLFLLFPDVKRSLLTALGFPSENGDQPG